MLHMQLMCYHAGVLRLQAYPYDFITQPKASTYIYSLSKTCMELITLVLCIAIKHWPYMHVDANQLSTHALAFKILHVHVETRGLVWCHWNCLSSGYPGAMGTP